MMFCVHDRRWRGPSFGPHPRQLGSMTAPTRGEGALVLLFCHLSFCFPFCFPFYVHCLSKPIFPSLVEAPYTLLSLLIASAIGCSSCR